MRGLGRVWALTPQTGSSLAGAMRVHTHVAEGISYGSQMKVEVSCSQTGSDFPMGRKAWGGVVLYCQEECGGGRGIRTVVVYPLYKRWGEYRGFIVTGSPLMSRSLAT